MPATCTTHGANETREPLLIVDDPGGSVDPALATHVSRPRTSDDDDAPWTVEFIGFIDAYTAPEVEPTLTGIAHGQGIVLDVGGVSFVDSAGMRLLEGLHDRVTASRGRLWMHDPSRQVRRLIGILGIDRFDVCEPSADQHRPPRHPVPLASPRRGQS